MILLVRCVILARMSLTGEKLEKLSQLVESAQSVVIALPAAALIDEVAAALSWAGVLRAQGKDVQLIAAELPSANQAELPGATEITTQLGKQNLVLSFAYSPEQVDKVSYHIGESTNRFYLTVRPQKGQPPLSQESLEISYAGAEADLILYLGVSDLSQLEPLSSEYEEFFRDTPSVVLAAGESAFGTVKILTSSAAGLCEESAQLFVQLGWEINEAAASLLLRGIEDMTDNMTSLATTPDTFETVASLLRAGARRNRRHQAEMTMPETTLTPTSTKSKSVAPTTIEDVMNRGSQPAKPRQPSQPAQPSTQSNPGHYQGRKRYSNAQG